MAKEDEEWERLKEKYGVRPERTKKPMSKAKLSAIFGIIVLCCSALLLFVYFNYFAIVVYNDVNGAVAEMIASDKDVKYSLSDLPAGRCYWVRPMYNESGHFVEIIEYRAEDKCIGVMTNKTVLKLDSAFNVVTNDCICSKNSYIISNELSEYGIDLKMVLK